MDSPQIDGGPAPTYGPFVGAGQGGGVSAVPWGVAQGHPQSGHAPQDHRTVAESVRGEFAVGVDQCVGRDGIGLVRECSHA